MICPICGKEMVPGEIGAKATNALYFVDEDTPRPTIYEHPKDMEYRGVILLTKFHRGRMFDAFKEAYHCPDCRKIIVEYEEEKGT